MKRLLGIVLSVALVLTAGVPAYAAESESKQLENVLKAVKRVIEISDDASFSYDSYQTENGNTQDRVWYLSWNKEKENINVEAVSDGTILSYFRYSNDNQYQGLSSFSREQGEKIARDFIESVLPSEIKMEQVKLNDTWAGDGTISYNFNIYKSGSSGEYLVKDVAIRVSVDKSTEKVTSYHGDYLLQYLRASLPADTGMIGAEKAKEAYLDADGLKLVYITVPDYNTKKATAFAAYIQEAENLFIDAKTGKPVYVPQYYYGPYRADGMGSSPAANESKELSPAEQTEVDRLKEFMSSEEAVKIFKQKVPVASKMGKIRSTSISSDYFSQSEYLWNIYFEEGYAVLNAKSGEIKGFDYYGQKTESKHGISSEKAVEIAEAFVKSAAPSKVADVRAQLSDQIAGEDSTFWTVKLQRYENDIPVYGNGLDFNIAKANGSIESYYTNWYHVESFPAIQDNLGEDGAFKVYDTNKTFSPMYVLKNTERAVYDTADKPKDKEASLVYGFSERKYFAVDPAEGTLLTMNGKVYRGEGGNSVSYSDIQGKWYEETVSKLLENGYYIEGEIFAGEKQITQEEFFRYLYSQSQFYYETDDFYDMLKYSDVIKEAEIAPEKIMTKQDAAKFAIRYLGLDKAATIKGIYKKPFPDKIAESYEGYAAISKGLGIIKGDAKGNFNGTKLLTRAEAAVVIFGTVNTK